MDVEQYANIKIFCNSFKTPAAFLDTNLVCIYCNREGFLDKGEKLGPSLLTNLEKPITQSAKAKVVIGGSIYCARVVPFGKEYYFCEFLDVAEVISVAEYTDVYNVLVPSINSMNHNISSLWQSLFDMSGYLHEKGDFESVGKLLEVDKSINSVCSDISNVYEYINELFAEKDFSVIEVYRLIKGMVERCNSVLRKCDRAIEFVADVDNYFIYSSKHHAIVALINALQNALLYSPNDCIPLITLSSVLEDNTRYVLLRLVNDSIYFVDEKNGKQIERDFVFQHIGLGIPIIKKFAEENGGLFSMNEQNGKVLIELKIPQYIPTKNSELVLESLGDSYYATNVPDFIEIKMNDVVNFYGKK